MTILPSTKHNALAIGGYVNDLSEGLLRVMALLNIVHFL